MYFICIHISNMFYIYTCITYCLPNMYIYHMCVYIHIHIFIFLKEQNIGFVFVIKRFFFWTMPWPSISSLILETLLKSLKTSLCSKYCFLCSGWQREDIMVYEGRNYLYYIIFNTIIQNRREKCHREAYIRY